MTGHLVLSTLHTNSAAGSLPRLLDMGAEPFLVASTLNVVVAQRLVRKLCSECRKEYKLTDIDLKTLGNSYNMDEVLESIKKSGILKDKLKDKDTWKDLKFLKKKGCEQCNNEGYHGRLGIYEVLEVDEEIGKMITQKCTSEEIESKAKGKGMLTMLEDGFIKIIQGITSVEEILRVTKD
jgi:type II secretory ATPase GspE/PulE/Tfp pilus assembly ATPase PilB-like protein